MRALRRLQDLSRVTAALGAGISKAPQHREDQTPIPSYLRPELLNVPLQKMRLLSRLNSA